MKRHIQLLAMNTITIFVLLSKQDLVSMLKAECGSAHLLFQCCDWKNDVIL